MYNLLQSMRYIILTSLNYLIENQWGITHSIYLFKDFFYIQNQLGKYFTKKLYKTSGSFQTNLVDILLR